MGKALGAGHTCVHSDWTPVQSIGSHPWC